MKVVVCSPLTLYAILAVIRQAVENFRFEQTASKMLGLFGAFIKQWNQFKLSMDRMGRKLREASQEYDTLVTRRTRALERPLEKIQQLKEEKGLTEADVEEEPMMLLAENEATCEDDEREGE